MKFIVSYLTILLVSLAGICNAEITGRVVDAETGKPVEGAVVLVQWTMTKGVPGMTHHEVHKIIEMETPQNGKIAIPKTFSPLINKPEIVIFKEGYIAWRSDIIYPGWQKRKDLSDFLVIKMEKFKEEFSRYEHYGFLTHGIIGASSEMTPKFSKIANNELIKALREKK